MKAATQYLRVFVASRSLLAALFYCSILILAHPAYSQVDSQRSLKTAREDQDYTFAFGLYSDKLYDLAGEQFEAFLQNYPSSARRPDALFLRAECSYYLKEFSAARDRYRDFLNAYPSSPLADDAWFRTGQTELSLQRYEEAIGAFKAVVDDFPESPLAGESAYWLGETYDRAGDMNNAVKYFTLSYEHFTGNPYKDFALYAVGWTYQKNGRYDDALEAYRKLEQDEPSSGLRAGARVRIGECLLSLGRYEEAIRHLEPLREAFRDTSLGADVEFTIAESRYQLQNYSGARSGYETIINEYPDHRRVQDALYGLGWVYLKTEDYDAAAGSFSALAERDGERSHEAQYRFGFALRAAGHTDSARSVFLSMVSQDPGGTFADDALMDAADISLRSEDLDGASILAARVIDQYPSSNVRGDALWMMGEVAFVRQEYAVARPLFLEAVKAAASGREITVLSSFRAALSAYRSEQFDTAASGFEQFRQTYPGHPKVPEAAYWQAEAAYKQGKYSSARVLYGEAVRGTDGRLKRDALYGLGWASYKEGRFGEAVESFGQLISGSERSSIDYDARMRQADALYAMKEYQRAEQAYRALVRLYPDTSANDIARYQAAQSAFRRQDLPAAYRQFQELVALMPASSLADDAQYAMGWINFRRKEYADAIKDFQVVINTYPGGDVAARAYYSLADGYYNMKQYGPAEKAYRDVIMLFPESQYVPDAMTGLQYCLIAQGKEDEAVRVIDDFIANNPGSASAQALQLKKAELLYGNGDIREAGEAYRDFLSAYPTSSFKGQALYWLGMTELSTGNADQAYTSFRQAWELPGSFRGPALLEALDAAIAAGKTEDALTLIMGYERSMSPSDIAPDVAYRKGLLFRAEGNESEAQQQLERVVITYSTQEAAYRARITLARIALDQNDPVRARRLSREVAGSRTDDIGAEAQFLVGRTYNMESNWRDAATAYLRVKYVFPSSREWNDRSAIALARAYRSLGEVVKARQTLEEFLKGSPDDAFRSEAEALLKELEG